MSDELPTEPGPYVDNCGDLWIRTEGGNWVDCEGNMPVAVGPEETEILKKIGPFTPMPRGIRVLRVYRVRNDNEDYTSDDYLLLEEARLDADHEGDVVQTGLHMKADWEEVPDDESTDG